MTKLTRRALLVAATASVLPPVRDVYAVYRNGRWMRCAKHDVVRGDRVFIRNSYWKDGIVSECRGWFTSLDAIHVRRMNPDGSIRGLLPRDPTPWSKESGFILAAGMM